MTDDPWPSHDHFQLYLDDQIAALQSAISSCQEKGHLGTAGHLDVTLSAFNEVRKKYQLLAAPPF